jgi:hypothetical protein
LGGPSGPAGALRLWRDGWPAVLFGNIALENLFHTDWLAIAADAQFAAMPYVFFLFLIERLTQP